MRSPRGAIRRARAALALVAALAAATLTGCAAQPASGGPRFLTPPLIRYTSVLWPVPLQLVGAEPGARLRLVARLSTARATWSSQATYTVPPDGTLDLAAARPQLARYTEPDSVGLFWSLRGPALAERPLIHQWMQQTSNVTITALDGGRAVAERTFALEGLGASARPRTVFTRDLAAAEATAAGSPTARSLPHETHEDVPVGRFFSARSIERPLTPAVVVFDDPSPGASGDFVAPLITQFGASVFVIPVANSGDGVHVAGVIDSGTVTAVLDWLGQRGDVDRGSVFAYGTGPSEQLALWLATRFPGRVAGVFGAGGTTGLLCLAGHGVAPADEGGIALPCQSDARSANPASVLPVRVVRGPVVLGCSEHDDVLPAACPWLDAAAAVRGTRAGDVYLREPEAAHAVTVPPGLPVAVPDGPSAQPTEKARIAFWNAVGTILIQAART